MRVRAIVYLAAPRLSTPSLHVCYSSRGRYNPELTGQWTREIADEIKSKLKNDLELPRYKFVVQVVVGEQRGEGVRYAPAVVALRASCCCCCCCCCVFSCCC